VSSLPLHDPHQGDEVRPLYVSVVSRPAKAA
jgi:hypothetical protein